MARASTKAGGTKSRASSAKTGSKPETGAAIDLGTLSRDELLQLQKDVDRAIHTYEKRKRDDALREMQTVAEKHGLTLKDIVNAKQGRSPQVPKYQHPENPALTWSGRGRQPAWFKEAVGGGASRESLLIV